MPHRAPAPRVWIPAFAGMTEGYPSTPHRRVRWRTLWIPAFAGVTEGVHEGRPYRG